MARQKTHPGQAWLLAGNISLNLPDDRPVVSSGTFTRANPKGDEPGVFLTFAGPQDGYWGQYWLHMSPETADRVAGELLVHAQQQTVRDLVEAISYAIQRSDLDDDALARLEALLESLSKTPEAEA